MTEQERPPRFVLMPMGDYLDPWDCALCPDEGTCESCGSVTARFWLNPDNQELP